MCTYPVQPVCTSLPSLLFILLFIKSHILFLHILLVLHFSLFYCTFYSLFLFFTYIYALVLCYFYIIFILLHCPLSGPDLIYILLLIIPCIIYYVTNKETLNLDLNSLFHFCVVELSTQLQTALQVLYCNKTVFHYQLFHNAN